MNTEMIFKPGGPIAKHGNKAFNGLSALAIVWMFSTFATKNEVHRVDARCDRCEEKRGAQWRRIMDHEVALARIGVQLPKPEKKE